MSARGAVAVVACVAGAVWAADASAQQLDLTITPSSFTFASADPDTTPVVSAPPLTVGYRVRQNAQGNWLLTVRADGDLTSGAETIPISNVTWIGTPAPPFQNGTMSRSVEQPVASGSGNQAAERTGSLTFHLVNSWTYSAGLYTQTFVFTLTAP